MSFLNKFVNGLAPSVFLLGPSRICLLQRSDGAFTGGTPSIFSIFERAVNNSPLAFLLQFALPTVMVSLLLGSKVLNNVFKKVLKTNRNLV